MKTKKLHFAVAGVLSLLATGGVWYLLGAKVATLPILMSWLIAINVLTFLYFGWDKLRAGAEGGRVPEIVLHTMSFLGGSPSAFLAMLLFRHKTLKGSFRILFWAIVVLQLALAGWIVKMIWWP